MLSLQKITLPCFGCSSDSWWYKCAKNTGKNYDKKTNTWIESSNCKLYKHIYNKLSNINIVYNNVSQLIKLFIPNMKKVIQKIKDRINKIYVWMDTNITLDNIEKL